MHTLNFATDTHNINGHGMATDIHINGHRHTQTHTDIQSEHTSSKYREAMTPFLSSKPAQLNSVGLFSRGRSTKNVCVGLCVSVAN